MSLKAFHIVFIVISTLLCAVMVAWGWNEYAASKSGLGLLLGITGLAGLGLLIPYYGWFRKKMRTLGAYAILAVALSALFPRTVDACSVCFGDPSSPMTKGLKVGILMLLFVIAGVLAAIGSVAFTWSRRAKALPHP